MHTGRTLREPTRRCSPGARGAVSPCGYPAETGGQITDARDRRRAENGCTMVFRSAQRVLLREHPGRGRSGVQGARLRRARRQPARVHGGSERPRARPVRALPENPSQFTAEAHAAQIEIETTTPCSFRGRRARTLRRGQRAPLQGRRGRLRVERRQRRPRLLRVHRLRARGPVRQGGRGTRALIAAPVEAEGDRAPSGE